MQNCVKQNVDVVVALVDVFGGLGSFQVVVVVTAVEEEGSRIGDGDCLSLVVVADLEDGMDIAHKRDAWYRMQEKH